MKMASAEALYKTQNPDFPDEDNGMDIQTCLEYLVKHGGPDGVKALAALPSLDELRAKIVGLVQAPATKIARVVSAPALCAEVLASAMLPSSAFANSLSPGTNWRALFQ